MSIPDKLINRDDEIDLSAEEFGRRMESGKHILIDVRTKEENAEIRIPDSILIDIYSPLFFEEINKLDKRKSYLIYCRAGNRSYDAVIIMKDMGFKDVAHLAPGILEWNGPTE